jgi:cysteine desulfurase / selenocysteine lyase
MSVPSTLPATRPTDAFAQRVRGDFPILTREIRGRPLVYLDNGATAHKPRAVLEAMERFHTGYNSNIHRGVHLLSQEATDAYEAARRTTAEFLNAERAEEIVFVRGATEAINLVASGLSKVHFREGDEIILSVMEHHANIVPWQLLAEPLGVRLRVVPILADGSLDLEAFERLLGPRTRLVALTHVSNALGTINPVVHLAKLARERGIPVLLDGCQAVPHLHVDVRALGCDFYVFSGHKLFGPTGIGVLWARSEWLAKLPPWQGGGDMIKVVSFKGTTFAEAPAKFEAGTPHIAGAIGLAAAMDYVRSLGEEPHRHEAALAAHAHELLSSIEGVRLVGTAAEKVPVFSFVVEGAHPHDVGTLLDQAGIAVRTGHHCAMPLMEHLGISGTSRASLAFYNTFEEIDQLARALTRVARMFG